MFVRSPLQVPMQDADCQDSMEISLSEFARRLTQSQLLSKQELASELREYESACGSTTGTAQGMCKHLVESGKLTLWQAKQLLAGRVQFMLGNYRLLSPLEMGGKDSVFLAEDVQMRRAAAIKVVATTHVQDDRIVDRFIRESQAMAKLRHTNILRAYSFGYENDQYFLAMEYLQGEDIESTVRNTGPLNCQDALGYIDQAAEGLAHAHAQGVIHRDVKPSNLLVAETGVVKLMDLGVARLELGDEHRLTKKEGEAIGTTDFMAPEQALDSHDVDERADIYSLGCTLYFMLTGQAPFPDSSVAERLIKHQTAEPTPIDQFRTDVPPELLEICRRMMAKDPEDRYSSMNEVRSELAALPEIVVDQGEPINVGLDAVHTPKTLRRPVWQSPWAWSGIGVGVVLLIGLAFLLTRPPNEGPQSEKPRVNPRPFVDSNIRWIPAEQPPPPPIPAVAPGRFGYALDCSGPAHPDKAHAAELEPASLTVAAWVCAKSHPAEGDTRRWLVSKNWHEHEQGHYALMLFQGCAGAYLNIGGGDTNVHVVQSDCYLEPGEWHHLAMSYDGARLAVYCDGKEVGAAEVNKPREAGSGHLRIGQRPDGYVAFDGKLDDVRVYNRALASTEIAKLAAATPRSSFCDTTLIAHWGFEETGYQRMGLVPSVVRPRQSPVLLVDEQSEFAKLLVQGCGELNWQGEAFHGTACVKVTPDQRYSERIPGMQIAIRENPGPGEYRYLRFAWIKQGGDGIAIQLAHDYQWGPTEGAAGAFRYHAGPGGAAYGDSIEVAADLPTEWTVVTRDLYADFGEFTLTGIALTPFSGEHGLFDQLALARAPQDFEGLEGAEQLVTVDPQSAALFVRCGATEGETVVQEEGYGVEIVQAERYDAWPAPWPHCWYHHEKLALTVDVPTEEPGELILVFCDGDTDARQQALHVEGRLINTYRSFHTPVTVVVNITAEDTADGQVSVEISNQIAEWNAVVSAIAFVPRVN